ncbi:MAG: hypothetical protein ABSA41_00665, partial [Terriglobia bacterium]
AKPVHTPKRSNRPTVQPKTQASIDDQHSEAILGKLGEKSRLAAAGSWYPRGFLLALDHEPTA